MAIPYQYAGYKRRAKTPQARLAIAEFIYRQKQSDLAETLYADPALMYPTTLSMQRQAQASRKGDARNAALFSFVCMMPNLVVNFEHGETQNRLLPVVQRKVLNLSI